VRAFHEVRSSRRVAHSTAAARRAAAAFSVLVLLAASARIAISGALLAAGGLSAWLAEDREAARRAAAEPVRTESRLLADDEFSASLRTERFWSARRSGSAGASKASDRSTLGAGPVRPAPAVAFRSGTGKPPRDTGAGEDGSSWYSGSGDTYRTMCVRLCDGYFWPVSFSVTDDSFERDEVACQRSCASPARLFVLKNPGGTFEQMEDLKGSAYMRLKTAFHFRTSYDAACTCRPSPWEKEAQDRHRAYAIAEQIRKGTATAAVQSELAEIRSAMTARAKTSTEAAEARRTLEAQLKDAVGGSASRTGSSRGGARTVASAKPAAETSDDARPSPAPVGRPSRNEPSPTRTATVPASRPSPTVMRLGGSVPTSAPRTSPARAKDDWHKKVLDGR
jgi:hypothetical protein